MRYRACERAAHVKSGSKQASCCWRLRDGLGARMTTATPPGFTWQIPQPSTRCVPSTLHMRAQTVPNPVVSKCLHEPLRRIDRQNWASSRRCRRLWRHCQAVVNMARDGVYLRTRVKGRGMRQATDRRIQSVLCTFPLTSSIGDAGPWKWCFAWRSASPGRGPGRHDHRCQQRRPPGLGSWLHMRCASRLCRAPSWAHGAFGG